MPTPVFGCAPLLLPLVVLADDEIDEELDALALAVPDDDDDDAVDDDEDASVDDETDDDDDDAEALDGDDCEEDPCEDCADDEDPVDPPVELLDCAATLLAVLLADEDD